MNFIDKLKSFFMPKKKEHISPVTSWPQSGDPVGPQVIPQPGPHGYGALTDTSPSNFDEASNRFIPRGQPMPQQGGVSNLPQPGPHGYGGLTDTPPSNFDEASHKFIPQGQQMPQTNFADKLRGAMPQIQGNQTNPWQTYGRTAENPYTSQMQEVFGDEHNKFGQLLRWGTPGPDTKYGREYGGENLDFDARAFGTNTDGSTDKGLFQVNSNTFNDFMQRKPEIMRSSGINSYEDMYDPVLNMRMAKIIRDEQGFNAWYGRPPQFQE